MHYIYVLYQHECSRDVTKISHCWVNTTSRRGIKQLGISLVLFFFYFPMQLAGEVPGPQLLMTALSRFHSCGFCSYRSVSCDFKDNFMVLLVLFHLPPWKWWGIILIFHESLRYHGNENFQFKSVVSITIWDNYYYSPKERKFYLSSWSRPAVINVMILSKLYAGIKQGIWELIFIFKKVPVVKILQGKKLLICSNCLKLIPHI